MARTKSTAAEKAYAYIKEKILSFQLLTGDTVSDTLLAAELGVSRTITREAIQRLCNEGLLTKEKSKVVVSSMTKEDIEEICQVREALESKAVSIIIERGGLNEDQIAALREQNELLRKCVEEKDYKSNFRCDDNIHAMIVQFSGNSRLISYYITLRTQISRARWLTILNRNFYKTVEDHERIIAAIEAKDLNAAQDAVKIHVDNSESCFMEILQGNGELQFALRSFSNQ